MAAAGKAKGNANRKVKDKWKAKEWYNVHAPRMFNEAVIGETPAIEPEQLMGRTAEITVQELTGDLSKTHIKLRFQITGVDGHEAKTTFIGHDLTSDYVRRLTRRKKTKTDHVVDIVTADGFKLRVKTMSIAERRIQSSQEQGIRQLIGITLVEMGKNMNLSDIVKSIISGDLPRDLSKACRVVIPIKRIEVRRTEVLEAGEGEPECIIDVSVASIEETTEEAAEESVEEVAEEAAEEEVVEKVAEAAEETAEESAE